MVPIKYIQKIIDREIPKFIISIEINVMQEFWEINVTAPLSEEHSPEAHDIIHFHVKLGLYYYVSLLY